jgi:hypothetical protein
MTSTYPSSGVTSSGVTLNSGAELDMLFRLDQAAQEVTRRPSRSSRPSPASSGSAIARPIWT